MLSTIITHKKMFIMNMTQIPIQDTTLGVDPRVLNFLMELLPYSMEPLQEPYIHKMLELLLGALY